MDCPHLSQEELPLGELEEEGGETKEEDFDEEDEEDEEAYERERQRNIAANQAKLLELGLLNSSHVRVMPLRSALGMVRLLLLRW